MDAAVEVVCPYCGEIVHVQVELAARLQKYREDCEVCCRPMRVEVRFDTNYEFELSVKRSSGV
jgi:hypothetical protein